MNIASAKDQIKDTVEAYLQKDEAGMYAISPSRQRPVFLLGAPGIGKTAIMEQIAQELQIGIVSYSMTHHTRQSALGLPRIVHREFEGEGFEVSEYTMSEIISAVYDYMEKTGLKRGILFLDEINCVSETLYPSMLQFLQFKTFGTHKVPDDWVIVCAGNPPEYNRSVHEFDIVTLDRMREIDVEPEYGAWHRYAQEKGLHPAITTFLESKRDCFYKVESRPGGGKSFVTARAWEDMAETIAIYEQMGKTVNRELIAQFLRDEEIADSFSIYYGLFDKYRSDYQVGRILAGEASLEIERRAKKAEFDERVALLGLMIDALGGACEDALGHEEVVLELRDFLREAKQPLNDGATVADAVGGPLRAREEKLARKVESGTAKKSYIRREKLVISLIKSFISQTAEDKATQGPEGFQSISRAYKTEVEKLQPLVDEANVKMDNAFDFIERVFSKGREMLVFMAELTTRQSTTQFVAHYGNEKYYANNDELQVDSTRKDLSNRIKELQSLSGPSNNGDDNALDMGSAVGLSRGSGPKLTQDEDAVADQAAGELSMEEFYASREFEYGFASMSKMILPNERILGKQVLDVCCRRGKGVYKLSAKIGDKGHVTGVDWSSSYIRDAQGGMERAWHDNHLKANNMDFKVAYPEDLLAAGIGDTTYDVIYINNVVTLVYDMDKMLSEFARVLRPGGLLIFETTVADREVSAEVIEAAREMGNSIQASETQEKLFARLEKYGFTDPEIAHEYDVLASRGYKASEVVETVPDDSGAQYKAITLYFNKSE